MALPGSGAEAAFQAAGPQGDTQAPTSNLSAPLIDLSRRCLDNCTHPIGPNRSSVWVFCRAFFPSWTRGYGIQSRGHGGVKFAARLPEPLRVQPDAELMLWASDGGLVVRPVMPRGPVSGKRC